MSIYLNIKFLTRALFRVAELSIEDGAFHVARHRVPPFVLETLHWLRANRAFSACCEEILCDYVSVQKQGTKTGNTTTLLTVLYSFLHHSARHLFNHGAVRSDSCGTVGLYLA